VTFDDNIHVSEKKNKPGARLRQRKVRRDKTIIHSKRFFNNDEFYIISEIGSQSMRQSLYTNENAIVRTKRQQNCVPAYYSSHFHKTVSFKK